MTHNKTNKVGRGVNPVVVSTPQARRLFWGCVLFNFEFS